MNLECGNEFCRELARRVPALAPILEAHLRSEDEQLLSYLFLSDVVEWAEENAVEREPDVVRLLETLNQGLAKGERDIPNLIVVGFMERVIPGTPLVPLLQGDLKGWYDYDTGASDDHPYLRRDGK